MSTEVKHQKPQELVMMEQIAKRKKLANKDYQYFLSLQKGYEGELAFLKHTEKVKGNYIILTDLLFEWNRTTFQIDCLIITSAKIFLYEIKNYSGDYYLEEEKFFKRPRQEIINPLYQLSRAESLLRQLLLHIGCKTPIESHVVFIHPAFSLYHAPLDQPIIFPTQIYSHLKFISNQAEHQSPPDKRLARKLVELSKSESIYQRVPAYDYDELTKGVFCDSCGTGLLKLDKRTLSCATCGDRESLTKAVLRMVKEFIILFPQVRLTTNQMYEWCGEAVPRRAIRRILSQHYQAVGTGKWTYYV